MRILITGGTGLIGRHLSRKLIEKGYRVSILSRKRFPDKEIASYIWNPDHHEIESESVLTADFIIHLAGENIGEGRWTAKRKKQILDSRVRGIKLLDELLVRNNKKINAFISASGCGYYGAITSEKTFTETDPPEKDFLGETCRQWEEAADIFGTSAIRTVKLRTGVVLASESSALKKMSMPVKFGLGTAIGSGKQYLPWIHINDLCALYIKGIEDPAMNGSYNAVAPEHTDNRKFTMILAKVLHRPFWPFSVPGFLIRSIFGEMSALILNGSRVSSAKVLSAGLQFNYPFLEEALNDVLANV